MSQSPVTIHAPIVSFQPVASFQTFSAPARSDFTSRYALRFCHSVWVAIVLVPRTSVIRGLTLAKNAGLQAPNGAGPRRGRNAGYPGAQASCPARLPRWRLDTR